MAEVYWQHSGASMLWPACLLRKETNMKDEDEDAGISEKISRWVDTLIGRPSFTRQQEMLLERVLAPEEQLRRCRDIFRGSPNTKRW